MTAIARVLSPSSQSPGHGPTPPEGGRYYHWWRDLQPHHYPRPGARTRLLILGLLISTYLQCPQVGDELKEVNHRGFFPLMTIYRDGKVWSSPSPNVDQFPLNDFEEGNPPPYTGGESDFCLRCSLEESPRSL
ncbi:hypothetical protein AVEN_78648-1 [Araneus ventricosus]|uniref:Uncharacterized protein n=1 Tax=Araneus ventricosus TaxID=182803 RepID=A0A4Y2IA34_ARAVE|nr:hypothetical protein AVEN_78648-1 [Araneus ventricosus]